MTLWHQEMSSSHLQMFCLFSAMGNAETILNFVFLRRFCTNIIRFYVSATLVTAGWSRSSLTLTCSPCSQITAHSWSLSCHPAHKVVWFYAWLPVTQKATRVHYSTTDRLITHRRKQLTTTSALTAQHLTAKPRLKWLTFLFFCFMENKQLLWVAS